MAFESAKYGRIQGRQIVEIVIDHALDNSDAQFECNILIEKRGHDSSSPTLQNWDAKRTSAKQSFLRTLSSLTADEKCEVGRIIGHDRYFNLTKVNHYSN